MIGLKTTNGVVIPNGMYKANASGVVTRTQPLPYKELSGRQRRKARKAAR